jgi:hypothetical protein
MFFIAPGLRFNNTYIIGKGTRVQEAIIALDIETLESNAM